MVRTGLDSTVGTGPASAIDCTNPAGEFKFSREMDEDDMRELIGRIRGRDGRAFTDISTRVDTDGNKYITYARRPGVAQAAQFVAEMEDELTQKFGKKYMEHIGSNPGSSE